MEGNGKGRSYFYKGVDMVLRKEPELGLGGIEAKRKEGIVRECQGDGKGNSVRSESGRSQ